MATAFDLEPRTDADYVVQPGDRLRIHTQRLVPRPCHPLEAMDVLVLRVVGTPPDEPVWGVYPVSPQGTLDLGFGYGPVNVAGQTLDQTVAAVRGTLKRTFADPQVALALAESAGMTMLGDEHVIGPDGVLHLGAYGRVRVGGMKLWQVTAMVDQRLSTVLVSPEVSLSVLPSAVPPLPAAPK